MRRLPAPRTAFLAALVLFAFAAGFASEAVVVPPPLDCDADGFCNTACGSLDPDCPEMCQHGKPCVTDADCQPLGECAVWRQCVCFG